MKAIAEQGAATLEARMKADPESQWQKVIERRSREIEEGTTVCRPVGQVVREIREKLHTRPHLSRRIIRNRVAVGRK